MRVTAPTLFAYGHGTRVAQQSSSVPWVLLDHLAKALHRVACVGILASSVRTARSRVLECRVLPCTFSASTGTFSASTAYVTVLKVHSALQCGATART